MGVVGTVAGKVTGAAGTGLAPKNLGAVQENPGG